MEKVVEKIFLMASADAQIPAKQPSREIVSNENQPKLSPPFIPIPPHLPLPFRCPLSARIFERQVSAYQCRVRKCLLTFVLPPKMSDSSAVASNASKVNPLMNFFLKRQAPGPLPLKKPSKKIKPSDDKFTDPLYQILAWRDEVQMLPVPPSGSARTFHVPRVAHPRPEEWGTNLQGIFINIDWNATPMSSFKQLNLSNQLLSNGMVFIWGGKTNIGEIMDYMDAMGYVYAENFTFVLLSRPKIPQKSQKQLAGNKSLLNFFSKAKSNEPAKEEEKKGNQGKVEVDYEIGKVSDPSEIFLNASSEHFCESQRVLYMFRKVNKKQSLELRHQRTSDVFFTIGEDTRLDWKAKEIVYKMIETLLINANYKEKEHLKLMELWAEKGHLRKGWITVSEKEMGKEEEKVMTQA